MIRQITCMFDKVACTFFDPVLMNTDNAAVRDFKTSIRFAFEKHDGAFYANKDDYDLYNIGTFDTETGDIVSNNPHVLLVRGSDVDVQD